MLLVLWVTLAAFTWYIREEERKMNDAFVTDKTGFEMRKEKMKKENKGGAIIITKDTETPQICICSYPFLLS